MLREVVRPLDEYATIRFDRCAASSGRVGNLMIELQDVILNVLRLAGPRGVNRTMLVKLVYFAELEGWRRYGRPVTGTPFRLHHYGAWAPEVVFVAEKSDAIEHSRFQGFHLEHNYKLASGVKPPAIPDEISELLAEVFERFGTKTATEVGALSKQTEPMAGAVPEQRLDLSVVAPRQPALRVRSDRLRRAFTSLDFSQRGSNRDLHERDRREIEAWSPARRRAASRA